MTQRGTYNQQMDYVAWHFTNHLISRNLLSPMGIPKQKLLDYYADYRDVHRSYVTPADMLRALSLSGLVTTPTNTYEHLIKFKQQIFNGTHTPDVPHKEPVGNNRPKKRVFTDQQFVFRNKSNRDSVVEGHRCDMCKVDFKDDNDEKSHMSSSMHVLRNIYRTNKKSLKLLSKDLVFEGDAMYTLKLSEMKCFKIALRNKLISSVQFTRVFSLIPSTAVKLICTCPKLVVSGNVFELEIKAQFDMFGGYVNPVIFQLQIDDSKEIANFLVDLVFRVGSDELADLGPTSPYKPPARSVIEYEEMPIIPGKNKSVKSAMSFRSRLQEYKVPPYIIHLLNRGFKTIGSIKREDEEKLDEIKKMLCNRDGKASNNIDALTDKNYVKRFRLLLWMEEHQMTKEIHNYDRQDQLLRETHNNLYELDVPGLAEQRPSVLKGDSVFVRRNHEKILFEGIVHEVKEETVLLSFDYSFSYKQGTFVDVQFTYSRYSLRLCYQALDSIAHCNISSHFFPSEYGKAPTTMKLEPWFNADIEKNEQQKKAIRCIVEGSAYPAPYILFGPPGTGKTITIVEAIIQIWALKLGKICICTPSNSAADLIAKLLTKHVPDSEILRLYALSRSFDFMSPELIRCSNYEARNREMYMPTSEEIMAKNIVVLTVVTAGRLVNCLSERVHFKYLFIDEAGHAMEPEVLIPIVGLLADEKTPRVLNGNLILTGDPNQLGPKIQSSLATALGLEMSYLERIMLSCDLYKNPDSVSYVMTKLINNYRSHPNLLYIPNKLFYDNALVARGDEKLINLAEGYFKLPNKTFPLLFHGVQGIEEREGNSPSYFNCEEMQVLLNYMDDLIGANLNGHIVKQSDVGVISPYRKQVQKCKQLFTTKRNWPDVDVASVEQFQGQEKLVILITTVRSRQEFLAQDYQFGIGFLRHPKRFNVAVTRAKALLIIIGNPDILQCDPHWRELINYCQKHKSYYGYKPAKELPPDFNPTDKLALDLTALDLSSDTVEHPAENGLDSGKSSGDSDNA